MRDFSKLTFLTLVLILTSLPASAAPQVTTEITPIQVDMTPISGPVWIRETSPYNYSLYGGITSGNFLEADETTNSEIFGFRFSVDQDPYRAVDFNAEWGKDGMLNFHMGQRYFLDLPTLFKPYLKWGGGMHFRPADNLVNIVQIKRLQLRGAVGSADLFQYNQYVYLEAGAGAAIVGFEFYGVLGLNLNF